MMMIGVTCTLCGSSLAAPAPSAPISEAGRGRSNSAASGMSGRVSERESASIASAIDVRNMGRE